MQGSDGLDALLRDLESKDIRLVLTDVDGTILPAGLHHASDRMVEAMHICAESGLRVGAASGRDRTRLSSVFRNDPVCCATMLATNGMEIYLDGELVCERNLPHEALMATSELVSGFGGAGFVFCDGPDPHMLCGDIAAMAEVLPEYAALARPATSIPPISVVKAFVFCTPDASASERLRGMLMDEVGELGFTLPSPGVIGIVPRGWSKADGVAELCGRIGIGADQVVVCGDSDNDIEMLAAFPNSVAVAGASDAAASAARWHIGRCEDDAVAVLLEGLAAVLSA